MQRVSEIINFFKVFRYVNIWENRNREEELKAEIM